MTFGSNCETAVYQHVEGGIAGGKLLFETRTSHSVLMFILAGLMAVSAEESRAEPVGISRQLPAVHHWSRRLDHEDILKFAEKNPLKIRTSAGIPKYGDPDLVRAVEELSGIPYPWTVPKMLQLFDEETSKFLRKLQKCRDEANPEAWPTLFEEGARCGHLARVLAASRDPRAATALGRTLSNPSFPGGADAVLALYHYFVRDLNYGLPPEKKSYGTFGFYDFSAAVLRWWSANKLHLEAQADEVY